MGRESSDRHSEEVSEPYLGLMSLGVNGNDLGEYAGEECRDNGADGISSVRGGDWYSVQPE